MARFTQKEFATECGVGTNYISSYTGQGYLKVDEEGFYDSEEPVNARFLAKRLAKPPKKKDEDTLKQPINPKTGEEIPTYEDSERLVKYFDSLKREKEVEKLQIEIDKKKGEVIPSELIEPFFLLHSQSLTTEFKNAMEDSLRNICHLYSVSITDVADYKGYITKRINEALDKATDSTVRQMKQLIQEYADKRGIGERNS
jgi:hypothetical protein